VAHASERAKAKVTLLDAPPAPAKAAA
jgi:hypothetical protein